MTTPDEIDLETALQNKTELEHSMAVRMMSTDETFLSPVSKALTRELESSLAPREALRINYTMPHETNWTTWVILTDVRTVDRGSGDAEVAPNCGFLIRKRKNLDVNRDLRGDV